MVFLGLMVSAPKLFRSVIATILVLAVITPLDGKSQSVSAMESEAGGKNSDAKLMVHYMPWHQTPSISGYWGWHWTMDHFNPEIIDNQGRREIASHFYPLTGPYDSKDPHILEYHSLLMKLSGVDGVIVDWYGIEDFWDYGVLNTSTIALFEAMTLAGLQFSICYEDRTVGLMVDNGHLPSNGSISHGQEVMSFMEDNWFQSDTYLKLGGSPVLFNFGPEYFDQNSDWEELFSVLDTVPALFNLNFPVGSSAAGAYPWPPMAASQNGVLDPASVDFYFNDFFDRAAAWEHVVSSAFPGFHDIYSEAGLGFTWGYLDALGGDTFRNTLDTSFANDPDIVQVVTWNDFGEGTVVEPTEEFGNQYLEMIQDAKRESIDPSFSYTAHDLELPLQVYNLRKSYRADPDVNQALDQVFTRVVAGDIAAAWSSLDSLNAAIGTANEEQHLPAGFELSAAYPNPFNVITTIQFTLPVTSDVDLTIYDMLGRKVATVLAQTMAPGSHTAQWNGSDFSNGLYFVRMKSGDYRATRKALLLK